MRADEAAGLPLAGVRVLDFTWIVAGPTGTKLLADFGADVVKVETAQALDAIRLSGPFADGQIGINRSGHFNNINRNKRGIAINLYHPDGAALARGLAARCDVVTENFTPGTMERWGIGYDDLRRDRADIIYCAVSGYGPGGRNSGYTSWGPTAQAISGMTSMCGLPGHEPAGWGYSHLDLVPGYLMATAVLMALHHRRRTGEGQRIDIAQAEVGMALCAPRILDFVVNGRAYGGPAGNHSEFLRVAPHNAYQCKGDDRWLAIVCRSDAEWHALTMALSIDALASDARFVSGDARIENEDDLDAAIGAAVADRDAYEVMTALQAAGVPCGVVQDAADKVERDAQLQHREFFVRAGHAEIGEQRFEGPIPRLGRTPGGVSGGAPVLGDHTREVLGEWLTMPAQEIDDLRDSGVFA